METITRFLKASLVCFFLYVFSGHFVRLKSETRIHSTKVTCNRVAMEVQHLCRLLTGPDKGLGSCLIGRHVSRLLSLH